MARIRTIKPEFFTSEDIVGMSPLARLLYVALWCEADKEGRLVWKPKTFKMRYMPADGCDINALCAEIVDGGLVVLYGDGLAYIPQFKAHQHINPRETPSQLPEPQDVTRQARVGTRQARASDAQGGREGKGREGNTDASASSAKKKHPIPDDFSPNETGVTVAREAGIRLEQEVEQFRNHHKAKGSTMLDWQAAWRTWVGHAVQFGRGGKSGGDDPYGLKGAI
jgi:hypothetical protein